MQQTPESIPLWLDIKTEYIDENIDRVILYLKESNTKNIPPDSFYDKTVELFEERITILLEEQARYPVCSEPGTREKIEMDARLLGAFLLVHRNADQKAYHAGAVFLSRLQVLVPMCSQSLAELALDMFSGTLKLTNDKYPPYPFSWEDIISFKPEILAHKICSAPKTQNKSEGEKWIEKKGTLRICDGNVDVSTSARKGNDYKDQVFSMEVFDGRLRFLTARSDRLKKTDEADIEKMKLFTRGFIRSQKDVTSAPLRRWVEGNALEAEVTGKRNGRLYLKSTESDYETIEGTLADEDRCFCYETTDFFNNLDVGDRIEVVLSDSERKQFTVFRQFIKFVTQERIPKKREVRAVVRSTQKDRSGGDRVFMWTEEGYPAVGLVNGDHAGRGDYRKGDCVRVVFSHLSGDDKTFVNVDIKGRADSFVMTEEGTKRDCIQSYRYEDVKEDHAESVSEGQLKEICRMLLACQKTFPSAADRYRALCGIEIICRMMSWDEEACYMEFIRNYLEDIMKFVRGDHENIRPLEPAPQFSSQKSVQRQVKIVEILMAYEKPDSGDILQHALDQEDEQLRKIAALIQSINNTGAFLSRSMKNVLKREIVKTLSLGDDGESDFDKENGIYLGIENERQEFKTSFFFAPKEAREQDQKMTVFKGICAFLNSRNGGTLYIGVNDMGYVTGIGEELEHLEKIGLGSYHGIDGYIRYITDQAKLHFDLSVLTHVAVNAMYDGQVCAVNVTPYEYSIVKLDGTAYIRLNNESVVMQEAAEKKILAERIILNQDDVMVKSRLIDAISNHRQAILHGYSSSNGKDIRDRHVEPFMFASGYEAVWCFDCEDRTNKVFKTDRISNVQVCKSNWMYADRHKSLKMDIFRMTGDKPIRVKLQLNMMARNMLIEEYEEARNAVTPTEDPDVWYLDTEVYRLEGVGRFYIGLANAIRIVEAPELKEYVKEFTKKHLLG